MVVVRCEEVGFFVCVWGVQGRWVEGTSRGNGRENKGGTKGVHMSHGCMQLWQGTSGADSTAQRGLPCHAVLQARSVHTPAWALPCACAAPGAAWCASSGPWAGPRPGRPPPPRPPAPRPPPPPPPRPAGAGGQAGRHEGQKLVLSQRPTASKALGRTLLAVPRHGMPRCLVVVRFVSFYASLRFWPPAQARALCPPASPYDTDMHGHTAHS